MASVHNSRTGLIAICATLALLSASCATMPKDIQDNELDSTERKVQSYSGMGTQALLRGDFSQAIQDLKHALMLDSKNVNAHNNLALAYYGMGRKDLANSELRTALDIDPKYSDAYINLGTFAADAKDYATARMNFNKALENLEYKTRHRALTNLAQVAIAENNIDEARQLLYKSLQANPEYCMSHFLLGSLYTREGNFAAAASEYKFSVKEKCTSNLEGHYQLGLAYLKMKQYTKAKGEFMLLVEQYPQTMQGQHAGDQLRNIP